jgi:integrase
MTRYRLRWVEAGQRRSLTFYDLPSAQARARVIEALGYLPSHALDSDPDTPTLADLGERHIGSLTGVTQRTRDDYRRMLRTHLGTLGAVTVDLIDRHTLATWTNSLRMSPKTVANVHGLVSAILSTAVADGWRPDNPAKGMRLPRADVDAAEHRVITPDECRAILEVMPPQWRPLTLTLTLTGVRWSEATALQVGDVDMGAHPPTVTVRRAWKRVKGGSELGPPKTRRARRTIALPPEVVAQVAPLLTEPGPRSGLLFRSGTGKPVHHGNYRSRVWLPALAASGIDPPLPRIHDLRHSHASWLIAAGVPLPVISRRLGHESIQTTVNVYGHMMPDYQAELVAAVPTILELER